MLVGFILETEDDKMEAKHMKNSIKITKRYLSLIIIFIMVLNMSVTVFAADARTTTTFYIDFYTKDYNDYDDVTLYSSANPGYISFSVTGNPNMNFTRIITKPNGEVINLNPIAGNGSILSGSIGYCPAGKYLLEIRPHSGSTNGNLIICSGTITY